MSDWESDMMRKELPAKEEAVCYENHKGYGVVYDVVYKGRIYPFAHAVTLEEFFKYKYFSNELRPELVYGCRAVWRGVNPDERILT